jgi:hypothetical protein
MNGGMQMPVARYFLYVGTVLLALLVIVDACLPKLPVGKTTDAHTPVIRIYSERKWPERIVFDTSTPMQPVAAAANLDHVSPAEQTVAVTPGRAREALAQLQTTDVIQMQASRPKKPDAHRQQKIAKGHFARPRLRIPRSSQYAWFGGRMWW